MAKIITKGSSSREIECDSMKIEIAFCEKKRQTKDSIKGAIDDCEAFLGEMKKAGIDIGKVRAGSNEVNRREYSEDKNIITTRKITIDSVYDLKLVTVLLKIIESGSYNVNVDVTSYVKDIDSIRDNLKVKAAENARMKADIMAKATGMEVVGVERIKMESNDQYIFDHADERLKALDGRMYGGECGDICLYEAPGLYEMLKPETVTEMENVYIEWILE